MEAIRRKAAERDLRIMQLRREGRTLQAIGNEMGLTRERVRQILNGTR
jgi:DNA-directed RNA polymerase sigma subunit (sigma70/sigma32)